MGICCCDKMREAITDEEIEFDEIRKEWNVTGCCGGGCYVLHNIKFCPFCGTNMEVTE